MSNMLNVDLARSMAADRDRYLAARDSSGPVAARPGLRERLGVVLRRMRREVAAPAVVAPIALAGAEGVALDEVA